MRDCRPGRIEIACIAKELAAFGGAGNEESGIQRAVRAEFDIYFVSEPFFPLRLSLFNAK